MDWDAAFAGKLAPRPLCDGDPHLTQARPKPEHTGSGFSHERQAYLASLGEVTLHRQWAGAPFSPARLPYADRTYFHDTTRPMGNGFSGPMLAQRAGSRLYGVRSVCREGEFATVTQALAQWDADKGSTAGARAAVIELRDSGTYHEALAIHLEPGEHLRLRAAGTEHPVLRMPSGADGKRACMVVRGGAGSRFMLDGVMLAGGAIDIAGLGTHTGQIGVAAEPAFAVRLRHCTLVPGWDPDSVQRPAWRGNASIAVRGANLALRIEYSILGPIRVTADAVGPRQLELHVGNSIIDGGHEAALAIGDEGYGAAMARAQFSRVTVIGAVQVDELGLAANSLFLGAVLVAQRGTGCVSFSYLAPGSRTPRCLLCQPELAQQLAGVEAPAQDWRVRPRFASLQYGAPGYGQLVPGCAQEITCGADDDTEMGAFPGARSAAAYHAVAGRPSVANAR